MNPKTFQIRPRGGRYVIYGSVRSGSGASAGWALWRDETLSGLDGWMGANGPTGWAVEELAGALLEVWPASGILAPQFSPPHRGRRRPAPVHRASHPCWRRDRGRRAPVPPLGPSPPDGTA